MKKTFITLLLFSFYVNQAWGAMVIQQFTDSGGLSVSDDFTGVEADIDRNGDWTYVFTSNTNLKILGDGTAGVKITAIGQAYWSADSFGSDQKVCVEIRDAAFSTSSIAVMARQSTTIDTDTAYWFVVRNNQCALNKRVAGADSTSDDTATNVSLGDTICISAVGSSPVVVTGTINDVTEITFNDSTSPILTGQPGVRQYGAYTSFDNFTADEL